jgi:hypothetical protein
MRLGSLLMLMLAGCGVQLGGGGNKPSADVDAATSPEIDAPTQTMPDADPQGVIRAACMAKGYAAANGLTSLYRASTLEKTWIDAEAECAADVVGATHLVVLSSTAESSFIQSRLGWVGLSDRATENLFVNVTAEPNDQRPFLNGQPDNGGGSEDCAQMKQGGLDDDQCDNSHVFVCECDGRAPTP